MGWDGLRQHRHPNWDFALAILAAVLPGSTRFNPDRITGHGRADWHPFDLKKRDMDDIEDDLLSRCADMTGMLVVVNDPSFSVDGFQPGPFFVDASELRNLVKDFGERVGSYMTDGHVIIVSPATGIVVMVVDDGLIAKIRGRTVKRVLGRE
ncbi:hypothetical protein [Actinoplanes derwentensis]|uniref:Uncharacterized protein n=1 Tax=Actinoplanes derwentensis TaxID=113562 RepID=A0A1H1ZA68_9ACTN|nr:hypothetical protein [Actinoplanes derwentensis]GID82329.1 hypothetical protein Ade03nite_12530 [Actinoplanes derwentensis]SDT30489.1 hypothetical protein SAMN04489716_3215 [Actinoplanes derwentensis]